MGYCSRPPSNAMLFCVYMLFDPIASNKAQQMLTEPDPLLPSYDQLETATWASHHGMVLACIYSVSKVSARLTWCSLTDAACTAT